MKLLFSSLLFLTFTFGLSQNSFIVVNQDSISLNQFKKLYNSNIEIEGIEKALDTYINFIILQQEADKTQIDTTARFQQIFAQSIQTEREKYLYPPVVKEELIQDIWMNLQKDRKVEIHAVGVKNPFNIQQKKERELLAEELHLNVCKQQVETKRVKAYKNENSGKTLWLRPFKATEEIERTTYFTKLGECSEIQHSKNGYFFIKVLEERTSSGIITMDFIFNSDLNKLQEAQNELNKDVEWEKLKKLFNSANKGLGHAYKPRWEAEIPSEFLKAINEIENFPYTNPFKGKDGFYLIKLHNHQKFDDLDNSKEWINQKIMQSDYALNYIRAAEKRAKEVVILKEDKQALNELLQAMGENFFASKEKIDFTSDKKVWSTDEMEFSQQDLFKEFIISRQYLDENTDFNLFIQETLPKYKTQLILTNYLTYLDKYESEFGEVSHQLKQSIKVNHYLENEIYAKAIGDTIAMKKFLKDHLSDFTWPKRYNLEIYRYRDASDGKTIIKMLKRNKKPEEILKIFEEKNSKNNPLAVVLTRGKFSLQQEEMPKNFNPRKKIQMLTFRNSPAIFKLNSIIKSQPKTFNESFNHLKEKYKMHHYEKTLKKLRENASISIPKSLEI